MMSRNHSYKSSATVTQISSDILSIFKDTGLNSIKVQTQANTAGTIQLMVTGIAGTIQLMVTGIAGTTINWSATATYISV